MRRLPSTSKQAGDLAGTALCQMTQGDWLSAPFSTPLVWNFAIQDSGQQSSELAWTSYIAALREQNRNLRALKEELAQAGL